MADETPTRRVLPARQRRESAAKRRASSPPKPVTPTSNARPTIAAPTVAELNSKPKKRPEKRVKVVHVSTPARSASTPISTADEILPTKLTATKPLPTSSEKQPQDVPRNQYQSIADSAILAASLHRSRMQWLCDGIFTKYWTKPVRRKKVGIEEPPNNPDAKSMQKLGVATITIEPHTFDATFYVVREPASLPPQVYKGPKQPPVKQPPPPSTTLQPAVHAPVISNVPVTSNPPSKVATTKTPAPSANATPTSTRPPTPPGGAKTTDPVIQMLASRAATDNHLKELMKVVATSRASPDQLREFQAHIDEFNAIVKRQEAEKEAKIKAEYTASTSTPSPVPVAAHPATYNSVHRSSPLNPGAAPPSQYHSYPVQPRQEPLIKHVVIEFTSQPAAGQPANPDRWLFPEYAVLDTQYGGTEMTCSFLVERKGADVLATMKDPTSEEMLPFSNKWGADTEYYQPVTMVIKATNDRTIATIARSAKSLPEVQKYMQQVMEKKTRAPQEFLVFRLPKEKPDAAVDFVDSAVELSAEDDDLKDFYPL